MEPNREPALTAGAFGSAIVALLVAYRIINAEQALAWGTIIAMVISAVVPLAQGWYTRQKVMPVATIEAAGLDPDTINRDAADPAVQPFTD